MLAVPGTRLVNQAAAVNRAHPLNRDLKAWWGATEMMPLAGGLLWPDLTRYYPATRVGPPAWAPGPLVTGAALDFDGSSHRCSTSLDLSGLGTGPVTVSGWARTTIGTTSRGVLLSNYDNGGQWLFFRVGDGTSPVIQMGVGSNATNQLVSGATSVNDGAWHWLCGVRDAGGGLTVYVDGMSDGTTAGPTQTVTNTRGVDIGALFDNTTPFVQFFPGRLADLRVSLRGLSADEVAALYLQSRLGHPETLDWLQGRAWLFPSVAPDRVPPGLVACAPSFDLQLMEDY